MRARVRGASLLLFVAPLAVWAQDQRELSCVKDVRWSREFLQKYPKAAAACREVTMKDGQKWIRFDADVAAIKGTRVTADFLDTSGRPVSTVTFTAASDATLEMDGRDERFSDLNPGDKISVWMTEQRVAFYTKPEASQNQQLAVVSVETPRG